MTGLFTLVLDEAEWAGMGKNVRSTPESERMNFLESQNHEDKPPGSTGDNYYDTMAH